MVEFFDATSAHGRKFLFFDRACVIKENPYSFSKMSIAITKVATVELIRELERRLTCSEVKNEK